MGTVRNMDLVRQENQEEENKLGVGKVINNKDNSNVDETDNIDVQEGHTPEPFLVFSHFDENTGEDDIDTIILKKSLKSVAGGTRELAAKRGKACSDDWKSVIISIAGRKFRTKIKTGENSSCQIKGRSFRIV